MKAYPENFQSITLGSTGSHTLQIGDITTKSVSINLNLENLNCLLPVNLDVLLKNRYAKS